MTEYYLVLIVSVNCYHWHDYTSKQSGNIHQSKKLSQYSRGGDVVGESKNKSVGGYNGFYKFLLGNWFR